MAKANKTTTAPIADMARFKASEGEMRNIELAFIGESPFNPRKSYDQAALQELADSIKEMGVFTPIRVRPAQIMVGDSPESGTCEGFEIVYGHRRFRAAKLAGEKTIPALVSDLTDAESARLQAVENLQREDLDPIEEAEGYGDYIKAHGVTKDQLAEHISKSRTYVYNRLKLATLCELGRKFVRNRLLDADLATEVARLATEALQLDALQAITADCDADGEPTAFENFRDGRETIERQFKRHLSDALFDRTVIFLVKDRPDCHSCPERAGNMIELNATGKRADICTSPECFDAKRLAHLDVLADAARKTGVQVIEGDEAKAMFISWDKTRLNSNKGVYDLDAPLYFLEGRTPRDALGKKLKPAETLHIIHPETGKPNFAVTRETLEKYKLIEAEKPDDGSDDGEESSTSAAPTRSAEEIEAERQATLRKEAITDRVRKQAWPLACGLLRGTPRKPGDVSAVLFVLVEQSWNESFNNESTMCNFDEWLRPYNADLASEYESWAGGTARQERAQRTWDWIQSLDADEQGRLCVELALFNCTPDRAEHDVSPDILMTVARSYGVDEEQMRERAGREIDVEAAHDEVEA